MKYKLETTSAPGAKRSLRAGLKRFAPLIAPERGPLIVAAVAMLVSSGATLVGPVIIGRAIDTCVRLKDSRGLLLSSVLLLAVYLVGVAASYTQIRTMGGVGRRVLFSLRNELFAKLQDLPLAFFTENKAGDLISRVNNDTDKLNQFVAQALMQFVSSIFLMTGVAVFVLSLNVRLGIAALLPAIGVFTVTKATGAWVKRRNMRTMQTLGELSAEVQESLQNFKVIVAFNRLEYFQRKFKNANDRNYTASVSAGFANNIFMPMYGFAHNLAMLLVVAYGITLIGASRNHRRPPHRVSALRQQFLWTHAATRNRLVVLPACARRARSHLRSARARVGHAGRARESVRIRFRAPVPQSPLPVSRRQRSSARHHPRAGERQASTRWSAQRAAARPPPHR